MEGPGGYQFVGRTLQMWNRYRQTEAFTQPWLLRFFDQIRFYPVSAQELQQIRRDFPLGNYPLQDRGDALQTGGLPGIPAAKQREIEKFQRSREAAFAAELAQWKRDGQLTYQQEDNAVAASDEESYPEGITRIDSPVSGSVWKLLVQQGDTVQEGDAIMILESMKMEIEIHATQAGEVRKMIRQQGQSVTAGQTLLWVSEGESNS